MSERTRDTDLADYVLERDDLRQWHHDFDGIREGDQRKHGGAFTDSAAFTHCICFGAAYRTAEPLLAEIEHLHSDIDVYQDRITQLEDGIRRHRDRVVPSSLDREQKTADDELWSLLVIPVTESDGGDR